MFRIDEQVSRSDQMAEHVPAFDLLHEAGDDSLFFFHKILDEVSVPDEYLFPVNLHDTIAAGKKMLGDLLSDGGMMWVLSLQSQSELIDHFLVSLPCCRRNMSADMLMTRSKRWRANLTSSETHLAFQTRTQCQTYMGPQEDSSWIWLT